MFAKRVISALFAFQVIAGVVSQSTAAASGTSDVWLDVDDYIRENRRQYNATLKDYLDQINNVKNSLEDQLKVLDKEKVLLLNTIQETNEFIDPLEVLSLPTRYCVKQYREEIPYATTVKSYIESCISTARNYVSSIVSSPNSYYNSLSNYYNNDLKNGLNNCVKTHSDLKSLNYTLCVTSVISKVNTYTISNRKNFATAITSSIFSLNNYVNTAVNCLYSQYNPGLKSIGAASRLIHNCLNGYLENDSQNNNNNVTIYDGCPNVIYMQLQDLDSNNTTVGNQLRARSLTCLEIRFV
ncbi:PREDICTED: uncharacterized protein LOC108380764 [Rhagoletis zephyria]|uniref:uncharacterized protein LOC108380764 n=1 Tax=Rhagoletis zephyria TaxID=28612 RepID=UPI0008112294|nr:PREDICTED: uncharacterized protein LOC108380764 [Rhagoletis zephyria]